VIGVVPIPTNVALAPPEQNWGVPVPVKVIFRKTCKLSPEFIVFEVVVKLAGTTTLGVVQVPPEIEPYPTPLIMGLWETSSVTLKVTLTPPEADAR
jgi:hypothetical protein